MNQHTINTLDESTFETIFKRDFKGLCLFAFSFNIDYPFNMKMYPLFEIEDPVINTPIVEAQVFEIKKYPHQNKYN